MSPNQASAQHRRVGQATLVVRPGGDVQGLYTELLDLTRLGRLTLRRTSRIEFNRRRQCWQVLNRRGRKLFSAPSRQACLDWEQAHFGVKA